MTELKINIDSLEVIQIVGEWAARRYKLTPSELVVAWRGTEPEGMTIMSKSPSDPYTNPFEDG